MKHPDKSGQALRCSEIYLLIHFSIIDETPPGEYYSFLFIPISFISLWDSSLTLGMTWYLWGKREEVAIRK
jgi:hypothetical protein